MRTSYKQQHTFSGFTLVEIMVSVAIFTIIIVAGMGSLVSLTNAYRTGQQEKQVHDTLNYALEMMTRDIRLGRNYHCPANSNGQDQGSRSDCSASTSIGFDASDGRGYVIFRLNGGVLYRDHFNSTGTVLISSDPVTNPEEVLIGLLRFSVLGTAPYNDYNQPRVWIQLVASSPTTSDRRTAIQTLVSQRVLDF